MNVRRIKRLAWLAGSGLLMLGLFFTIPVSHSDNTPETFDIQVVLGGNTLERSTVSHALWQRHRTPILVTGDLDLIYRELLRRGVPEEDLIHEPSARNTWENASLSKPILEQRNVKSVVIVTSWFHTSRARACFEKHMRNMRFTTTADTPPQVISWNDRKVMQIERMKKMYYWATRSIWPW